MLWIISYDVPDDKRRTRIHKILKDFGRWVHYSVFECDLEPVHLLRLQHRLGRILEADDDSIHFYPLCERCRDDIERWGVDRVGETQDLIV